jgi:hypothetical protein
VTNRTRAVTSRLKYAKRSCRAWDSVHRVELLQPRITCNEAGKFAEETEDRESEEFVTAFWRRGSA